MSFPKDFVWGAAASSYQIEGNALNDGRGECIWYRFSHTPGKIVNNDTGDLACDHYHRYRDDVALMQELGLPAYRLSTSWARVLPQGVGMTNPAGLDFYDKLIDELLSANIQPYVTLYHWDLPQALQDRGGWMNRDCLQWFNEYVDLMSRRLGDRVKNWTTFNEPWVIAFLGYWTGVHAPGYRDMTAAYRVAHHVLLSHGAAVPVIRQNCPDARVGLTVDMVYHEPATNSQADQQATIRQDVYRNFWFLDGALKGQYDADMVTVLGDTLRGIDDLSEVKKAAVPIDFIGLNYYTRQLIQDDPDVPPLRAKQVPRQGIPVTAMNWEVFPEGLKRLLVRITQTYNPPAIYITENGAAFHDQPPTNGVVKDPQRVDYLKGHFAALESAIAEGVPLKGYFVWSLLDNFEWSEGYRLRFGIVYVDYATQKRTLKESALYFRTQILETMQGA